MTRRTDLRWHGSAASLRAVHVRGPSNPACRPEKISEMETVHQALPLESERLVGVIDPRALRRAELASFLGDWAAMNGCSILAIAPDGISIGLSPAARLALGVLNLGAASLNSEPQLGWLRALVRTYPGVPVAVISDVEDRQEVMAALRAGARAFLPTTTEPDLACRILSFTMMNGSFFPPEALLQVGTTPSKVSDARPGTPLAPGSSIALHLQGLTTRQQAVLTQLQAGMSNRQIGDLLGVRESTVKEHVRHIMKKLGAANRTQAALGLDVRSFRAGLSEVAGRHPAGSLSLDGALVPTRVLPPPPQEDSSILRAPQDKPLGGRAHG